MKMKRVIYALAMLLVAASSSAQNEVNTLKACIERGLENNYSLRIVRNKQQVAENNATMANAGMLPKANLSAGYSGTLDNSDITSREDGSVAKQRNITDHTLRAGLDVQWMIFDGFKMQADYNRLRELKLQSETQTRLAVEDFVAKLTAEYYNFVQQSARLRNLNYAVKLSRERLRIVYERYIIGDNSRLDLLQARVDFNADSSQYMSQQELVTSSRIRINELMANKAINEKCVAQDTVIKVNDGLKWDELSAQMAESNVSLLIADRNTEISMLDLKAVKARNYPYLKLAAGYGYTLNRYGSGTTKTRGTLGPNVGLNLGFTIFDGNRRREQRNAKIEVENAQYTREQIEQSLSADLANFWQAYLNNLEVIKLERQNLIAAKENYNIAMERYLLGDLPGIDMREAQKSLLDAEERILTAEYNTKLCEISLMQISGNILSYLKE
jgi:outer membrane protein TolC